MIAFVSMVLAGIVTLGLWLTETVTNWWLLVIGLGGWLVIFLILKIVEGKADGKSVGEAAAGAFEGIGDAFSGDSGGCGSGGSD